MAGTDMVWSALASQFPPSLDTKTASDALSDGFSPDSYGLSLDTDGVLSAGTVPSGSSHVADTETISDNVWTWYFRRLWRIDGVTLLYNSPEYRDVILPQDLDGLRFDEDGNSLLTFFPFAGDSLFVAKASGAYQIPGAGSLGGAFTHGDIEEALKISNAANAIMLDNIAYVSNDNGFFAWDGREIVELSRAINNDSTTLDAFKNKALTADFSKKYIIGGTDFVYDVGNKRLMRYSGSAFRFTTRTVVTKTRQPFTVDKIALAVDGATESKSTIALQIKRDDEWEDEREFSVIADYNTRRRAEYMIEQPIEARQFTLRLTDVPSHIKIHQIDIRSNSGNDEEGWSE